jgi:hypothetical protein
MIQNHWLRITQHDSQPLAQLSTPCFTTTGSALHNMTHNHWVSITHLKVCYAKPSGCESWCIMLSKVVVNHSLLCWASGCESWFIMLSMWLWIMVCYANPSGCESWCIMLSTMTHNHPDQYITPWLTTTGSVWHTMIHNHWFIITRHKSQPLAQHNNPWVIRSQWLLIMVWYTDPGGCESWCVMLRQWLWIKVCYAKPSGCESW